MFSNSGNGSNLTLNTNHEINQHLPKTENLNQGQTDLECSCLGFLFVPVAGRQEWKALVSQQTV